MGRYLVGIVVAPTFGDQVTPFAVDKPVWIADTPGNRRGLPPAGAPVTDPTRPGAITTFKVREGQSPDAWCAEILSVVVEHHGEFSHDPPVSDLDIVGASPTPELISALAEYGFTAIVPGENGFRASAA